jgi:hypothetical protein
MGLIGRRVVCFLIATLALVIALLTGALIAPSTLDDAGTVRGRQRMVRPLMFEPPSDGSTDRHSLS